MQTELAPAKVRLSDELGLLPGRAAFENAAATVRLDLARDPEWYRFNDVSEDSRHYYNKHTSAAWQLWQACALAESERCAQWVRDNYQDYGFNPRPPLPAGET